MKKLIIESPASTANLGPGFDIFGLALELFDKIIIKKNPSGKLKLENTGYEVPTEPSKNTGGIVAHEMLKEFKIKKGLDICICKGIPPYSSIGSSGATAAGVACGINEMFNLGLTSKQLVEYASHGEKASTAEGPIIDNVTSSIFGGFTMIVSKHPLEVVKFNPPNNLSVVVAIPNVRKQSLKYAREVLPKQVPLESVVYNTGHASLVAAGFALGDFYCIKKGLDDCIIEPSRANAGLFIEYAKFKQLGEEFNAGIAASGYGPAIIAYMDSKNLTDLLPLAFSMKDIYDDAGVTSKIYCIKPSSVGAHVVN